MPVTAPRTHAAVVVTAWTPEHVRAYATACGVTPPRPSWGERTYATAVHDARETNNA